MNFKPLFALGALATVISPAFAQQSRSQSSLSVIAGIFLPSSGELRKDLGTRAIQLGFGAVGARRPSEGSWSPDYTAIIASGNGNKLFILPITYGYEYHFGVAPSASALPYVRPFAGVAYYDYSITDTAGSHFGVKRLGSTYGIEGGLMIGTKIKLSASYNFFTPSSGFSFNGLSLAATYALFSL